MCLKVSGRRKTNISIRVGGSLKTKQKVDKDYDFKENSKLYFLE